MHTKKIEVKENTNYTILYLRKVNDDVIQNADLCDIKVNSVV